MTSEELDQIEAKWTATGRKVAAYMGDHETFPGEIRDAENFRLIARVLLGKSGDDADGRAMADAYADVPALVAEVRKLAVEVERLGAMVPRWVKVGAGRGVWRLRINDQDVGHTQLELDASGRWYEWPTCARYPDLPAACAAVCRRLGMPYIAPPDTT